MPSGEALSEAQRVRLAQSASAAEKATGLSFRIHIGPLVNGRDSACALLAESGAEATRTVLVAVDPAARGLEIVTGRMAATLIDDRSCALAALAMTSSFSAGDLVGGIVNGVQVLADHGRRAPVLNRDRL